MTAHASLSPSSSHRWLKCTASPDACKNVPDTSSEAADFGTFCHEIAAKALRPLAKGEGPPKPALSYLNIKSKCGRFEIDKETADYIQQYLDAVEFALDLYGGTLEVEILVKLTDDIWGTVDALILSEDGTTIVVIDLKMGAGVFVDVRDNPQLQIYAGGAMKTYHDSLGKVETVITAIVQPRHHQGDPWREHTYEVNELFPVLAVIESTAITTRIAPTFQAGEWCQFCPIKATCKKRREESLDAAREAFGEAPAIDELSDERIAEILTQAADVKKWLNDLETHATKRASMGVEFPGLKLVEKMGLRKFSDADHAAETLRAHHADPNTVPVLVSPAEAERRLQDTGLSKKQAKAIVGPLTHKPSKGAVLVSETDSRPVFKPATF